MDPIRLVEKVTETNGNGRRRRGRSTKGWLEHIEEFGRNKLKPLQQMKQIVGYREG